MIFNIAPAIRYKIPRADGCSSGIADAGACLPRHMAFSYHQSACDPAANSFFHEVLGLHDVNAACLGRTMHPRFQFRRSRSGGPPTPGFLPKKDFRPFRPSQARGPLLACIPCIPLCAASIRTRLHSTHRIDRPQVSVACIHLLCIDCDGVSLHQTKKPFSGLEVPDGPALRIPGTVANLGCSPPRAHATLSQLHEQATSSPQCVALLSFLSSAGNHSKDRSSMKWETSPAWVRPACPSDPVKRTAH
jgi:hypothetical protein